MMRLSSLVPRSLWYVLLLLVVTDLAFMAGHIAAEQSAHVTTGMFRLDRDRGYPEFFQYLKFFWIVITLALVWRRTRAPVYPAWCAVFVYMLLDDSLQVHERGGEAIAARWAYGDVFGLRAVDLGELTVTAIAGVLLFGMLALGYLQSDRRGRSASQDLMLLIGALVFFGVALDMTHQIVGYNWLGDIILIVEDGGEMVAVSVILAYVGGLLLRGGGGATPLWRAAGIPARWRRVRSSGAIA